MIRFYLYSSHKSGFTFVEVVIGSLIFSLFLGSALMIFFQSQKSITKTAWINSSAMEESIALRKISELAKQSSFPSTIMENIVKIADKNSDYFAVIPKNYENVISSNKRLNILRFPICTEQTASANGTIAWVSLWLVPSAYSNYSNLELSISKDISYFASPPEYAAKMTLGKYSETLPITKRLLLLHHIEKITIEKSSKSERVVKIGFILSFPKNNRFKKKVVFSPALNVEIISI